MDTNDIFEPVEASVVADTGRTVHSNTHNHALVENPFAWDDEDAEAETE